ncbi:UDP-glucuronosyltransferase 1A1-like isoform X1 [Hypomesus transpacificus]|uniref:UDP-glucuronosyltransferase 1A1-like isoform X1 n=2 Tax=Hypomesus transpacificus TaxID=137520 RepID=UPI001F07F6E6|nr:UDP-glucuronosyltransferase 1A1-like isoform X1 [Hypomesus transpacificus]
MGASAVFVCLLVCLALGLIGAAETGETGPAVGKRPKGPTGSETDENGVTEHITVQKEEASKSVEPKGKITSSNVNVTGSEKDTNVGNDAAQQTGEGVGAIAGPTGYTGRLLVVPMDGSHWVGVKAIAEEMGRRGHQVTVVIPEISMRMGPGKHYTTVTYPVPYGQKDIDKLLERHKDMMSQSTKPVMEKISFHMNNLKKVSGFIFTTAEGLLFNASLISHLSQQGFDAMLTDPMIPTGSLIARKLGLPSVGLLRGIPCGLDLKSAACPSPPSYVPRFFTKYTDVMSFKERVVNVVVSMLEPLLCTFLTWHFDQIAKDFLEEDVGVAEVLTDTAIWLMRYDFMLEFPRPLMPNMVLVGGINCNLNKPLPEDLESWVSSAEHGFVVFTLGSMVSSMPEEKAAIFLAAFEKIPQRVLWRHTGPVPDHIPQNVMIKKWLPQNELLTHHGVKAFLTHAGSHGLYEALCHGVPMVMLPLGGDQTDNAYRLAARGVGVVLDINEITVESLLQAINEVINTTRYKDNMMKLSAMHKDRPIDPLDLSVYWTEFVMRHKGAAHLRVAAHDLNWFQYHSLDVIGCLLLVLLAVVMVIMRCIMLCVRRFTSKRKQD